MKKYKYLSYLFAALAILLSNVMCVDVTYHYWEIEWGMYHNVYAAPPDVAFFGAIPYGIGILICVILAWVFHKKCRKTT